MSDENEMDLEDRLNDISNAAYSAETNANDAKLTADRWATECEFMLQRITALEKAVDQLTKRLPKK